MTTPSPFELAGADPVGAATGWLAGHPALAELRGQLATGEGRWVGPRNAPPFPCLQVSDDNADLRNLRGLSWVSLTIGVLGDPAWAPDGNKAALRQLTIAVGETLAQLAEQPAVGGCVFTEVTVDGIRWAPLAPANQPRYVLTSTLWSHPAWTR